ncbi:MAG: glycosyltransferase family 4 protein [Chthoniobacteraceae bacterium]
MKIALITTDNREHLKDYGCPTPYFGTAPEALIQGFSMLPDVEVHVISSIRKPMDSPKMLADNVWYHPILVPKIGWLTTAYQGCASAIRRKLREIGPDIVHGQGTERDCAICAVLSGFPNVLTIHGNMRIIAKLNHAGLFSYTWLVSKLENYTIPRSAGVVCITNYTQDAVKDLARRTWVVPNGVDARFFSINNTPNTIPNIIVVGNISPRKNQIDFIRSLDVVAAHQKLRLSFFGGLNRADSYGMEFLDLLKERPWCQYGGFIGREELREQLAHASGLVLPSIEDNCPMVVLEAMAAGVPVVGPNVGGVPDLIQDGINGQLCNPLEAESMRQTVERLINDRPGVIQQAIAAKADALERYHPRNIALRHLEIYRDVLKSSS